MADQQDEKALIAVHTEIERRDEHQIIEYLSGGVVDEYVYAFTDKGGRRQVGLSWAGTREMAQARGCVRVDEEPHIMETDTEFRGMAFALDTERNVGLWGGCHQPKRMMVYVRDPDTGEPTGEINYIDDPFAYEKCVAKCQRNALKSIMPVTAVTKFIIKYCEENGIELPVRMKQVQKSLKSAGARKQLSQHDGSSRDKAPSRTSPPPANTEIATDWTKLRQLQKDLHLDDAMIKGWFKQNYNSVKTADTRGALGDTFPPWVALPMVKKCIEKLEAYQASLKAASEFKEQAAASSPGVSKATGSEPTLEEEDLCETKEEPISKVWDDIRSLVKELKLTQPNLQKYWSALGIAVISDDFLPDSIPDKFKVDQLIHFRFQLRALQEKRNKKKAGQPGTPML